MQVLYRQQLTGPKIQVVLIARQETLKMLKKKKNLFVDCMLWLNSTTKLFSSKMKTSTDRLAERAGQKTWTG